MKLSIRDKVILIILAAAVTGFCEYKFICVPLSHIASEKQEEHNNAKAMLSDITPLVKETESLKEKEASLSRRTEKIRNEAAGATVTNEEFLVYLGNSVALNDVCVTGFNHLETKEENRTYKMILDFEMKGNSNNINCVLTDLDNMGIKYSVGSFSYRQNEEYNYLKRFYDDLTDLPWYKEPESIEDNTDIIDEIPSYEDDNYLYNEPFYFDDNNDMNYDVPYSPEPETVVPEDTPKTDEETEPQLEEPKSIDERLNELLEPMVYMNNGYNTVYLDNKTDYLYNKGQEMRLSVTVCLIMFKEPKQGSGILKGTGAFGDGVF